MSGTSDPDLTIVVVNWNTRELLRQCLDSIPCGLESAHRAETWVVDNASQDGSAAMVAETFPDVHLVANDTNVGFARANNQAIRQARGRYVLLLNSDTKVLPGALSALVQFLDGHPNAGAAGCRLLNADGTKQRSAWMHYPNLGSVATAAFWLNHLPLLKKRARREEETLNAATNPVQVKHLLGACLMVRRLLLDKVGLMDEDYFMYLEETDWCQRINAAGAGVFFLPSAEIIHFGQQSAALAPDKASADWCRSLCRFYRRQYRPGLFEMALLKSVIFLNVLLRFTIGSLLVLLRRPLKTRPSLAGCVLTLSALRSA